MRSFATYLQEQRVGPLHEAAPAVGQNTDGNHLAKLSQALDAAINQLPAQVDALVADLRTQLMNPNAPRRGVIGGAWDKIKQWWNNFYHGHDSDDNPYRYVGRMGELGRRLEQHEGLSVTEYRALKNMHVLLEQQAANAPIYKIDPILKTWSQKLKGELTQVLQGIKSAVDQVIAHGGQAPETLPAEPEATPVEKSVEKQPESQPAVEKAPEPAEGPHGKYVKPYEDEPEEVAPEVKPEERPAEPAATPPDKDIGPMPEKGTAPAVAPEVEKETGELPGKKGVVVPKPEEEEEQIANPDENLDVTRNKLKEIVNKTYANMTDEEKALLKAVRGPWDKLPPGRQNHWNRLGNGGFEKLGHNKGRKPFLIPWVLRKGDPRIPILQKYYPDIYEELLARDDPEWSRIETDRDTEESVRKRINQFHELSLARQRKGKTAAEAEAEVEAGGRAEPEAATTASAAPEPAKPRDGAKQALIDRLKKHTEIPEDMMQDLMADIEKGDFDQVDNFLSFYEKEKADDVDPPELSHVIPFGNPLTERVERYRQLLRSS